jgi:hypothetical protein
VGALLVVVTGLGRVSMALSARPNITIFKFEGSFEREDIVTLEEVNPVFPFISGVHKSRNFENKPYSFPIGALALAN